MSSSKSLNCWKCGATLKALGLPLSRRDECPICTVELHVCRMCRHYDENLNVKCRQDHADPPREKERANFCDYFAAKRDAYRPVSRNKTQQAKQQLAELFGEEPSSEQADVEGAKGQLSDEEKARIELKKLFGDS